MLRQNMRRYRGAVAACVVALAGLFAFAVYAGVQAQRQARLAENERRASAVAVRAQDEAVRSADELRRQLTYSTIERGRLLGLSGNLHAAESLLWPEHLRALDSHQTFYALWELYANSRCAATLPLGQPRAWRLRLSPDGRTLAASGTDPALMLYDAATLERTAAIAGDGSPHQALAFAPDGSLALGNDGGRITVHEGRDGRELGVLRESGPAVLDAVFSPDGRRLYASLDDGTLAEFDVAAPAGAAGAVRTLTLAASGGREPRGTGLAMRPDGAMLAVGCSDATIRAVSLREFAETRRIENPDEAVPRLAFSPDGASLACNGSSRVTRLFDTESGALTATLSAPNGAMGGVTFTPDGSRLLTSGWWYLHVWNVAERRIEQTFSLEVAGIEPLVSPDGSTAWLNLARTARAWDLDPLSGQRRLAFTPTSRTLARFAGQGTMITGEGDGSVLLINDTDGTTVATLGRVNRRVRAVAVHPVEPLAATVSVDGVLCLFDLRERRMIGRWSGFRMATNDGVRFDPSGTRLLLPAADSSFRVLEVPSGRVALTLPVGGPGEALGVAWSPDGTRIAVSTRQPAMRLYDAASGSLIREFDAPPSAPWTVIF
ncbi:MAG: PD40 domain-containing protein, partial [Phycisphaerae bacterium]|nr:PD40 domain-containing protein [Phycisphaerae bacterium]